MVVLNLMGGLGNQMFQLAYAYVLSKTLKLPIFLNKPWYDIHAIEQNRPYMLDLFTPQVKLDISEEITTKDLIVLNGYYQDFTLWGKYTRDIKKLFHIASNDEIEVLPKDSLAVHYRKGDYHKLGWVLNDDYYVKAKSVLEAKNTFEYKDIIKSKEDTFKDFIQMKSASKFIIANSTFSWWAAYLSGSKEVVYPASIKRNNINICKGLGWKEIK